MNSKVEALLVAAGIFTYICFLFAVGIVAVQLLYIEDLFIQLVSFWMFGLLAFNIIFIVIMWKGKK